MKKVLLILFVIASVAKQSHSQTNVYHPFPDSNAVWINEKVTCLDWQSNPPCISSMDYHLYYYFLKGDTTVGTNVYHKIYRIDSSAVASMGGFLGGIREDANRKIFLTDFSTAEKLLYDFSSTNIGDTIVRSSYLCFGIISSIDSVQLDNGQWRKRYTTTACGWPSQISYVIEGIGSNYDLIQGPNSGEYVSWSLRCFHQNNSLVYIYDTASTASCYMNYLHTGIDEQQNKFSFLISPNPFSTQTTLQANRNLQNATLTVYNSFGQEVKQIKNISSQSITLQRDNLPSGLYFIRLTIPSTNGGGTQGGGDDVATSKLIISDN